MYTQFFGNYLLTKGYVTTDQLFSALQRTKDTHMRLGTLAIHAGYMTASEVDTIIIEQTHADRKFGELAIEFGYLTTEQVFELLRSQQPDFLLLGQTLVDDGIFTNTTLETVINEYRSANELFDLDMAHDSHENVMRLFENFFVVAETPVSSFGKMYMELLFNNFIRFIGEDFTPLMPSECTEFPSECCVCQKVIGDYSMNSYITMDINTACAFASRYVGDEFTNYDEYVQASMEDFLNLHNGLFIVNASNSTSVELTITPPEEINDNLISFENTAYHFPILFPFGTIHFVFEKVFIAPDIPKTETSKNIEQ